MRKEYSVKWKEYERIISDFRSIGFYCIRCGSKKIKVIDVDSNPDGNKNYRSRSNKSAKKTELHFYLAGILHCRKCNHRFYVKILDQGTRNTNLYIDNCLS